MKRTCNANDYEEQNTQKGSANMTGRTEITGKGHAHDSFHRTMLHSEHFFIIAELKALSCLVQHPILQLKCAASDCRSKITYPNFASNL